MRLRPPMNASDVRLLAWYRAGDESAFDLLWTRHRAVARRSLMALGLTAGPTAMEELRMSVAASAKRRAMPDGTFTRHVLRTANGLVAGSSPLDAAAGPLPSAEHRRRLSLIGAAYQRLRFWQKCTLWYLAVDGLNAADIAVHLGRSVGSVERSVRRALRALRSSLSPADVLADSCAVHELGRVLSMSELGVPAGAAFIAGRAGESATESAGARHPHARVTTRYAGLLAEDVPPIGLCVATLTVLDCSGFEHEFDPLLLDERIVQQLVHQGESL
jgi:hypothetical protein